MLITCPECNREVSDKASSCPNCGYPIVSQNATLSDEQPEEVVSVPNNIISTFSSHNPFRATKSIGPVQVDETNKLFKIKGKIIANGKKEGLGKSLFKASMAISTLGLSTIVNNKDKIGANDIYDFEDLIGYELLEDDSIVTSGGVGQALIGGALFGGFGAVAGGITGKRVQKKKVESLIIKVTLNNFSAPCIMMPLITKPMKTNSKEYQSAFNQAHQILAALDVITHNK